MATNVLENIDTRELGQRLQQARKRRGLTQADVADILGSARTTVTAIEKGERRLKAEELIKLAGAYGRPVSEFVAARPPIESFEVQFRAAIKRSEFRAAIKRSEKDEEKITAVIEDWEDLCRNYLELEEIVEAPLAYNYPPEYQVVNLPADKAAESIALRERSRLGLGDGPLPLLREVLEQEVGLRIFYLEMPSAFSEMYSYDQQLGGCMAVNLNHPEQRRRWSMAHGYLHFLAHRHKPVFHYFGQYQRMPESERLAEAFAMHFLMPAAGLVKRFSAFNASGKFTPADLCTLAHYYGVSVQALDYRLEGLGLLPAGTWDKLKDRGFRVRKAQEELGLNEIPQRTDRVPLHYQHLAIEALDQGLITEGHFARLLRVDRLEARRVAVSLREHSSGMDEASTLDLTRLRA